MATPTSRGPECLDDATVVEFLEGGLSPEDRAAVDAHVDGCASCLALVAALGRGANEDAPDGPERYELRDEVGRGGMGQVFSAFDHVLGREVALKCVRSGPEDAAAARRFEREMELTARLQHPAIIPVYDAGLFPDGSRYFAMRLVKGKTLDATLEATTSFGARLDLVPSIRRACEAVAYAHEQSVIHRDLKPANVLIGPFGETVVLDWGLAKDLGDDDERAQTLVDVPVGMTKAGAVMGTEGYIAPEVSRGEPADRRADVYSLGRILAKLLRVDGSGDGHAEVREDLRAIVARATDPESARRYPDAGGLCEDLRRFEAGQTVAARDYSLRSRARRFVRRHRAPIRRSLSFVAVGMLVGLGVAMFSGSDGPAPCSGAEEGLAGIWDSSRRAEVRDTFAAVDLSFAPATWTRIETTLDAYADEWVRMHVSACQATAQGAQSSELLDLRMACLDRAATELGATVDVLAAADATVVAKADGLVGALRSLERCGDLEALSAEVEPPPAAEAPAVEAARIELARVETLRRAARFAPAQTALENARTALAEIAYAPVQTELAVAEGLLLRDRGDFAEAEDVLERAISLATRWDQRRELRRSIDAMMHVLGAKQLRPAEALRYRAVAEGLAAGDPVATAELHNRLATAFNSAGAYAEAVEQHEAALAIRRSLGDPVGLAMSHNNYGVALKNLGKLDAAEAELREAIRLQLETLGSDHPQTSMSRSNLATVLDAMGKGVESEAEARKALDSQLRVLPAGHPDLASSRIHLGHALFAQGKYEEAEAAYRRGRDGLDPTHPHVGSAGHGVGNALMAQKRYAEATAEYRTALELYEATLGAEHPRMEAVLLGLGNAFFMQGKHAEAEVEYRALLESRSRRSPVDPAKLATAHSSLSNALLGQSEHERAAEHLRSALELYVEHLDAGHPYIARTQHNIANVLFDAGRANEALPYAEQAWAARKDAEQRAEKRAGTAYLLADVLWAAGGDKARARALAREAKADYAKAGPAYAPTVTKVDDWLKAH